MPWVGNTFSRNNGQQVGPTLWQRTFAAGRKIIFAEDHDTHDEDLAQGINESLNKHGQNTPTQDLPMAGRRHLNVGLGLERSQYATLGQLLDSVVSIPQVGVAVSGNRISLTSTITFDNYVEGMLVAWVQTEANPASPLVILDQISDVPLLLRDGSVPNEGDILPGPVLAVYLNAALRILVDVSPRSTPFGGFASKVELNADAPPTGKAVAASDRASEADYGVTKFANLLGIREGTKTDEAISPRGLRRLAYDIPILGVSGSNIIWNVQESPLAQHTLTGNRSLPVPIAALDGTFFRLIVRQDGTGGRTLSLHTDIDRGSLDAPALASGANAYTVLDFMKFGSKVRYLGAAGGYT